MEEKQLNRNGGVSKCCWTIDRGVVVISKSISAMANKLIMNGESQEPHNVINANVSSLRQKRKQDGFVGSGGSFKYKKWEIFMGPPPAGYFDGMKIGKEKPTVVVFHTSGVLLSRNYSNDKWHSDLMYYER